MSPKLKLSRRDRMRRNPIPWVILLLISIFLIYSSVPNFKIWQEDKKQLKILNGTGPQSINELERKNIQQTNILKQTEEEFESKSRKYRNKSSQQFPLEINKTNIVRIIELYILGLGGSNFDYYNKPGIVLESINFGSKQANQEKRRNETSVTINIESTIKNLKIFIEYLQRGEITSKTITTIKKGRNASISGYFNDRFLPIVQIQSIKINENNDEKVKSSNLKKKVSLQIIFFSK